MKDYVLSAEGFKLYVGDMVYWNDPDADLCSDYYYIDSILEDNIVVLTDESRNTQLEAFGHELS
jgi:hypothetical protein